MALMTQSEKCTRLMGEFPYLSEELADKLAAGLTGEDVAALLKECSKEYWAKFRRWAAAALRQLTLKQIMEYLRKEALEDK